MLDSENGAQLDSGANLAARVIVVALIQNQRGEYLLCKKPSDRGVFPGEWGLPGGGIEPGETLEQALRREVREELSLELHSIEPLFFSDAAYPKYYHDGTSRSIYMIFLLYRCMAALGTIQLNPEFEQAAWVAPGQFTSYSLNRATVETFSRLGLL
jgi:nucleoside triphosphatase